MDALGRSRSQETSFQIPGLLTCMFLVSCYSFGFGFGFDLLLAILYYLLVLLVFPNVAMICYVVNLGLDKCS
jgi:hypothetical protein